MDILRHLLPRPRPYWHVDAKWICGLLFIFSMMVTLLLTTVVKITDESRGPKIAALAVGGLFVRGDSLGDIEEIRTKIRQEGGAIRPIPMMPDVTITEKDLALSLTDIKLKVFLPLTTQLYSEGVENTAAKFAATAEEKEKFVKDAAALKLFTRQTNTTLKSKLPIFMTLSILFLLAVIYFSAGWGRLANPGLQLLVVGLPGTLLALMIAHPHKDDGGSSGFLTPDIAQLLSAPIGQTYHRITLLGVVLLVAALIGKIVTSVLLKRTPKAKKA